jgi:hypothetical protein
MILLDLYRLVSPLSARESADQIVRSDASCLQSPNYRQHHQHHHQQKHQHRHAAVDVEHEFSIMMMVVGATCSFTAMDCF